MVLVELDRLEQQVIQAELVEQALVVLVEQVKQAEQVELVVMVLQVVLVA